MSFLKNKRQIFKTIYGKRCMTVQPISLMQWKDNKTKKSQMAKHADVVQKLVLAKLFVVAFIVVEIQLMKN